MDKVCHSYFLTESICHISAPFPSQCPYFHQFILHLLRKFIRTLSFKCSCYSTKIQQFSKHDQSQFNSLMCPFLFVCFQMTFKVPLEHSKLLESCFYNLIFYFFFLLPFLHLTIWHHLFIIWQRYILHAFKYTGSSSPVPLSILPSPPTALLSGREG